MGATCSKSGDTKDETSNRPIKKKRTRPKTKLFTSQLQETETAVVLAAMESARNENPANTPAVEIQSSLHPDTRTTENTNPLIPPSRRIADLVNTYPSALPVETTSNSSSKMIAITSQSAFDPVSTTADLVEAAPENRTSFTSAPQHDRLLLPLSVMANMLEDSRTEDLSHYQNKQNFLSKKTIDAITEATKVSDSSASGEPSGESFSARMEICLIKDPKKEYTRHKNNDTALITLDSFEGNTTWLLGENTPEIVFLEELIPEALQQYHAGLVKTALTNEKNVRGNWDSLSRMLSRPIKILSRISKQEMNVDIKMNFHGTDEHAKKIIFLITIRLPTSSHEIPETRINNPETSEKKRIVYFASLVESYAQTNALEKSTSSLETSQTPIQRKSIITVKISDKVPCSSSETPAAGEIDFVKALLSEATDGTYLPATFRGKALSYTTSGTTQEIFLTSSYVKIQGNIYSKNGDSSIAMTPNGKIKQLINVETGETLVVKVSDDFNDSATASLEDFKLHHFVQKKETNPFKLMLNLSTSTETNPDSSKNIIVHLSPAVTLVFRADSFNERFTYGLFSFYHSRQKQLILMDRYDSDLNALMKNPQAVPEKLLKKLPFLIVSALNNLHTGKASKNGRRYIHTNISPEKILLKIEKDNIEVAFCNLTNCIPLNTRQSPRIPGRQMYLAPELLSCFSKMDIEIAEELKDRIKDIPEKDEREFQHTIESNVFAIGIMLTDAINEIFTAPHLQKYKEDMLKVTSLLLCYSPNGRANLPVIISMYQYLYDVSESPTINPEYKFVYEQLISALIKLTDFHYDQAIFWPIHSAIQIDLTESVINNNRQKTILTVRLINFLHYMKDFLIALNPTELKNYVRELRRNTNLLNKLNLLSLHGFSAPSSANFIRHYETIANIISIYNAANESCLRQGMFKYPNAEKIVRVMEDHKENLCNLTAAELDEIQEIINQQPNAITPPLEPLAFDHST